MAYTPPAGDSVGLSIGPAEPAADGGAVVLSIGATEQSTNDRTTTIAARTRPPTVSSVIRHWVQATGTARTRTPTVALSGSYDPNLLSDVNLKIDAGWQDAALLPVGHAERWQPSVLALGSATPVWKPADFLPASSSDGWQDARRLTVDPATVWQEGSLLASHHPVSRWQDARRIVVDPASVWQDSRRLERTTNSHWQDGLLAIRAARTRWQDGSRSVAVVVEPYQSGLRIELNYVENWQPGGYPSNARRYGPPIPPPPPPSWTTRLRIRCPRPGTRLSIGATACPIIPVVEIESRRTYVVLNSASLTLLDDTPLPVTSMTIKTDANSWCWGLSASLTGADAWALVQPTTAGYPVEVKATLNDWTWTFVLDYPGLTRKFNNHNLTVEGRSRSAWLDEPWTPKTTGKQSLDRTAQQLAEEALDNTGWTLNWQLDDWFVPGGRFEWDDSLIGRIARLLKPVEGCLYTDPVLQVLTAYPRYPTASWLWDGLTPDLELPEAVLKDWSRKPNLTTAYNGVYVSGTDYGVLAFVKIAGTDGMSQPGQPIVEALCCDDAGVAARMRGLAFLSANGGSGYTLSGSTILGRYGHVDQNNPTLILPGRLVKFGNKHGMARSVSINASRSGGWTGVLNVTQSVEIECWDVEA